MIGAEHIFQNCLGLDTQEQFQKTFGAFVSKGGMRKWMIGADYCIHDKARPNDVFAFTVYPYDKTLEDRAAEIRASLPVDIKHIRRVTPELTSYLRSPAHYHFCFIVNPDRRLVRNVIEARTLLDNTLQIMRSWQDAATQTEAIKTMEIFRREADSPSFNIKLFNDMLLTCTFIGFIAAMIGKYSKPELIGWFPDRDNITEAWARVAAYIGALNQSAFCQHLKAHECRMIIAYPSSPTEMEAEEENGSDSIPPVPAMWFDELIRIPDYYAGTLAVYNIETGNIENGKEKHQQILAGSLADNPNLQVLRLKIVDNKITPSVVYISRHPPNLSMDSTVSRSATKQG